MPSGWLGRRATWDSVGMEQKGEEIDAPLCWFEWEGGCRWVESVTGNVGSTRERISGHLRYMYLCNPLTDCRDPLPGDRDEADPSPPC